MTTLDQIQSETILAWIVNNDIKTENGTPLDFHDHRYLIDIYTDDSPNLVEMKAAQLGLSTMEIFRTLWRAYYRGLDIIYILPTFTDIKDFAGGKVNRIVDNNPVLASWVSDKDSTEQKRVGKNTIYYRGSWNERQALMIAADWLILDEFDRCKQEVLEQYESRLQHSKYGYKSIFSNPSAPDFGVHKYFKKTDQKMWFVNHSCGVQVLLDEECLDYDREIYCCPNCTQEITDNERRMGEWRATTKGEEGWSGYWIPLWINPRVPASKIAEYKRTKTAEYFENFVAGQPYVGGGNKISYDTITRCLVPTANEQTDRVIIGVDTGLPIYYTLANKSGFFHYGRCSDAGTGKDPYKELEYFLIRWPTSIIVSDQGGDLSGIRILQARYPGRVFLVWYRKDKKTMQLVTWGEGEEYGKVVADRNRCIQLFVDEMLDKRVTFNCNTTNQQEMEAEWHDYTTHWMNIYRTWETDDNGFIDKTKGFVWNRQGPDHWVHSTIYARIGLDKFMNQRATVVGADPLAGIGEALGDRFNQLH